MTMSCKKPFRFFILSLLVLAMLASPAMAVFQDPLDVAAIKQRNPLNKPFIGSDRSGDSLVVVGPRGLILFSRDQGANWVQAEVPVQSDLVAVDMVSGSRGWAVGHDGVILTTSDGGATWVKQFDGLAAGEQFVSYYRDLLEQGDGSAKTALELTELNYRDGPALPYLDVWFRDELTGFAVGGFGNIVHTDDGGKTWTPWVHRIANDEGFHLTSIAGVGEDVFIGSERGVLFRLDAEQQFFEQIETDYLGTFTGVIGADGLVIAYGLQGMVYLSRDRGDNWQEVNDLPGSTINHAFRRADGQGYVFANQSGELIISDRHFASFDVMDTNKAMHFTSVVEVSDQVLLVTALEGLAKVTLSDRTLTRIRTQE